MYIAIEKVPFVVMQLLLIMVRSCSFITGVYPLLVKMEELTKTHAMPNQLMELIV